MTNRRNFFRWVSGLVVAALAPKMPTPAQPQLTAPEWSGGVPVGDIIREMVSRAGWASGDVIVLQGDECTPFLGLDPNELDAGNDAGKWQDFHSYAAEDKKPKLTIDYTRAKYAPNVGYSVSSDAPSR